MKYVGLYLLLIAAALSGCDNTFGDKTDLDFIEPPTVTQRQVAYVPILPVLDGFVFPTDIIAGFDELMYVVDAGTEQIYSMDLSGRILGSFSIPGVTKVAQDRALDILAIGTKDTLIQGVPYTLPCIYRLDLKGMLGYGIQYARIVNEIVHPFYFKSSFSAGDAFDVLFTGIAVIGENDYYVSRTGPKNNSESSLLTPDQSILLFSKNDEFETPIVVTSTTGQFRHFFKEPAGIVSAVQPPQLTAGSERNFITIFSDPNEPIKVRSIGYVVGENSVNYIPATQVEQDTSLADQFITDAFRFGNPSDITITGDGTNLIFITDTEKDSLFQFTFNGLEGIQPPPASNERKYIPTSFGGLGVGVTQFNDPMGVAYADEIVYVADAGNGRILRFKLTLDFD